MYVSWCLVEEMGGTCSPGWSRFTCHMWGARIQSRGCDILVSYKYLPMHDTIFVNNVIEFLAVQSKLVEVTDILLGISTPRYTVSGHQRFLIKYKHRAKTSTDLTFIFISIFPKSTRHAISIISLKDTCMHTSVVTDNVSWFGQWPWFHRYQQGMFDPVIPSFTPKILSRIFPTRYTQPST